MNQQLLGKTQDHLTKWNSNLVHMELVDPLSKLNKDAQQVGIDLAIASGFRSYERQKLIWNEKITGKRQLLDSESNPLNIADLSPNEILFAILKWSAIPGFSRHHWGCDFDIFDKKALPKNYKLQLIPAEYYKDGIFSKLTNWLDSLNDSQFIRPYQKDTGGVAIEPWHISYRPVAKKYEQELSLDSFINEIKNSSLLLKQEILNNSDEIFFTFVSQHCKSIQYSS